jgi:ribosomal protein S12 methylthiotransferase accessory factor
MIAAVDLASAGLGALHVVDDGFVGEDDLHGTRLLTEHDRGHARTAALSRALARAGARSLELTLDLLVARDDGALEVSASGFDLILAAVNRDDLVLASAVARLGHATGTPSLTATIDGFEAVLGPAVLPGETACWNCARLRRLANTERSADERAMQDALLRERPARRRRAALAPAAGVLGHELAFAAIGLLGDPGEARLAGQLLVRNLVSLRATHHDVLRVPDCGVCGGAPIRSARPRAVSLEAARDPEELRRMLRGVVDARTGIVNRLVLESLGPAAYPEAPRTAMAILAQLPGAHVCEHACRPATGAGKGKTAVSAMIRAVGEAVERYSASSIDAANLRRATVNELRAEGATVLAPSDLCFYGEADAARCDFPYARVSEETQLDWVLGHFLDGGAPVYVPALCAFFDFPAPASELFCQVSSNGLAAGATTQDASFRAALELLERDAFMMTWLARRPARRVKLDASVHPVTREVARQLAERGVRLEVYLLEGATKVAAVMAVGYGDGHRWPGATVALAAHPSPRAAIDKAVLEQGHVGPYLARMMTDATRRVPERPEDVHTLDDHAIYYFPKERAGAFAFLDEGTQSYARELDEPEDPGLTGVKEQLRAAGLRIAIVDVTSADLAPTPFRVVRAVGAGFVQIHFGHLLAQLGNPRLVALLGSQVANPDPHPMA